MTPFPQRIAACDGRLLNVKLGGRLRSSNLEQVTIVVYRYNDFDLYNGVISPNSRAGLINTLCRAALRGVRITFVTRDPLTDSSSQGFSGNAANSWYRGLKKLAECDGVTVLVHKSLHAKVYLLKSAGSQVFYAVGSSNLTLQGMGFRWADCNVLGYSEPEYVEVEKEVMRTIGGSETSDLQHWALNACKTPAGLSFLAPAT